MAEFNHGLGVCGLTDRYLPGPGSTRGYAPSVFVDRLILMLQAGGQSLEDLRELTREAGPLRLLGQEVVPDPDTVGDWLRRMGDPQTGHAGLVGLGQVRDALTARLLRRDGHETYTLDADATLVGGKAQRPVELQRGARVHADARFFVGDARVPGRRISRGPCVTWFRTARVLSAMSGTDAGGHAAGAVPGRQCVVSGGADQ